MKTPKVTFLEPQYAVDELSNWLKDLFTGFLYPNKYGLPFKSSLRPTAKKALILGMWGWRALGWRVTGSSLVKVVRRENKRLGWILTGSHKDCNALSCRGCRL